MGREVGRWGLGGGGERGVDLGYRLRCACIVGLMRRW
jgi:hypothetical protein